MSGDAMLVTLTVGQLRSLIREGVVDALGELEGLSGNKAPALLDRAGLARELGLSVSLVDRLRLEGCPLVRIGDLPRFELAAVLDWLRNREVSAVLARGQRLEPAENKPVQRATGSTEARGFGQ